MKNNTAGVREREDANRTRDAGNRDEVEGVVANTLNFFRDEVVGFMGWLDSFFETTDAALASGAGAVWVYIFPHMA